MESRLLYEQNGLRTFAVVFSAAEEAMSGLTAFAKQRGIAGAQLTGLGAFEKVVVGYFEWESKRYRQIAFDEQVEVLSFLGNVGVTADGAPKLHVHAVLGKRDGTAQGGHLLEGRVRPTLEVIVTETPKHLQRRHDEQTGLALIDLGA